MEITEFDKRVYNLYLSSVRSCQNKPYTLRKNFDGFVDDDKFAYLKALSSRFSKTPHLMCKEYFSAPFTLGDEGHFDLKYYSSMRAVGAFSRLSKSSENRPPDEQLDYLKQSFLFIYKFCKDHELKLNDYTVLPYLDVLKSKLIPKLIDLHFQLNQQLTGKFLYQQHK